MLPKMIRDEIWRTYKPGQENTITPSEAYVSAAKAAQDWIAEHVKRTARMEWSARVSRELYNEGGEAEKRLCAKCYWEHMTRTAVLLCWGDPRDWPA
jgi:hypothetical protein